MPFEFQWYDEDRKTAMRYSASGHWNWRDYHTCVRASTFTLHGHDEDVDTVVDLRGSTRETLPSGLPAHVRTFGKKLYPQFSGRAVVIGMPPEGLEALEVTESRELPTPDGVIRFVDDEDALNAVLQAWRDESD